MRAPLPALLLCLACQSGPPLRPAALVAQGLTLSFEPGAGALHFELPGAACAQPPEVSWELGLDGRPFAAGLEAAPRRDARGLSIDAPLTWRHLGWRDGDRYARVRLKASVRCPGRGEALQFEGQAEVLVHGGPVLLDSPRD